MWTPSLGICNIGVLSIHKNKRNKKKTQSRTNVFLCHTQPVAVTDTRGETFDAFCKLSSEYAKGAGTEQDRVEKAMHAYVNILRVTDPPWSDTLESQWKEFYLSLSPQTNNVYLRHVTNPSGRENRGKDFSLFIEASVKLTETFTKENAVAIARDKYATFREAEKALSGVLKRPSNFPEWNQSMWEEYFYEIAPSEGCIQRIRLKRAREVEEDAYETFKKTNEVVMQALGCKDSETLKNLGSTMSNSAANYKALFLNRK